MGDVPQHAPQVVSGAHDLLVIVVLQAHPHAQLGAERGRLPQRRGAARPRGGLVSRLGCPGEDPDLRRAQPCRRAYPAMGQGNLAVQIRRRSGVGIANRNAWDREPTVETRARDLIDHPVVIRRQTVGVQVDAVNTELAGNVQERPDVHLARGKGALKRQ